MKGDELMSKGAHQGDAAPLKWIVEDKYALTHIVRCPVCGRTFERQDYKKVVWNFCPVCGEQIGGR